MFYDHGLKVNMLYYNLKYEDIMKKYDAIEKQYWNIDNLFNLPETKETNFAILSAYNQIVKDITQFVQTVTYAKEQVIWYKHAIGLSTRREASARKICEKSVSKEVSSEWLKHIGSLYEKIQVLGKMESNLEASVKTVNDIILKELNCGLSCKEDALAKEEKILDDYARNFDELSDEMDYFIKNDSKLNPDFVNANLQALKTRVEKMDFELDSERGKLKQSVKWLYCRYKTADSYKKRSELKKKLKKTEFMAQKCQDNDEKYVDLLGKCFYIKPSAIERPKS